MIGKTSFLALLCVFMASSSAVAEVAYTETELDDNNVTTIRLKVTPAAEPVPVLQYRFIARDIDLKEGNAAPYYYRALLDLPRRMEALRKNYGEEFDRWYQFYEDTVPLDQLPLEKMREAVEASIGGSVGDHLVEATHRRECDFQLDFGEIRGVELISVTLAEFQHSRELTRMLALRTRLEIAERRYADAVDTMRMSYRLAQDFASEPFLVAGLIGIAESSITSAAALELIAAPDSPNLFWALTELPQPLIDMRPAARFEIDFGPRMFPFIHRAETTDRSSEEWNRLFTEAFANLDKAGAQVDLFGVGAAGKNKFVAGLAATAAGLLGYSHAKAQLITAGMDRERVETMAVGQVMAIYTERHYQRFANDWEKLWYLPYWEMRRYVDAMEQQIVEARLVGGGEDREVMPMISLLLPAMEAARNAQVRLEREIAALRVIEALRMHAAAHNGQLPARLEDISQVPVPPNPATGQAFNYRLEGQMAILELPASDGTPGYHRRFEIQIAAKGQ